MSYSEAELFSKMCNCIQEASSCAKGLAQARNDIRWQAFGLQFEQMRDAIIQMAMRKSLSTEETTRIIDKYAEGASDRASVQRHKERMEESKRQLINEVVHKH